MIAARATVLTLLAAAWTAAAEAKAPKTEKAEPPPWVLSAATPIAYDHADQVVGTGTPDSVTAEGLQKALSGGGIITFDTGGKPATILVTRTLDLAQGTRPTVIDGRGLITLDGGGKTGILQKGWKTELTVQRLRFINGAAPESGGAINAVKWDGRLSAIDCVFDKCRAAQKGPDIGGGAIRALGQKKFLLSGCTFTSCEASNGGAVGSLGSELDFVNCSFIGNHATGLGGGLDAGPKGQGGIGGAYYMDGCSQNAEQHHAFISACLFKDNVANDHGGVVFNYTYRGTGSLVAYHACIFDGNSVPKVEGQHMGWPGGIYVQEAPSIFSACTFVNNSSVRGPCALFLPSKDEVTITNCEFFGNLANGGQESPSFPSYVKVENLSTQKPDTPVAVAALGGRWPGAPQPAKTEKPKAKEPVDVPPPVAAKPAAPPPALVDKAAVAQWEPKLLGATRLALDAHRSPKFHHHRLKGDVTVKEMDADNTIHGLMNDGEIALSWKQMADDDRESLAADVARDTPDDQAMVAFYLLLAGVREGVDKHLATVPAEQAQAVLKAFGIEDFAALAAR